MDRFSFGVRLGRRFQTLPLSFARILEFPILAALSRAKNFPNLIIILALPRSGSTLLYQLLCHGIPSIYLSNFANALYQLPFFGGIISFFCFAQHRSTFTSNKGFVQGLSGPAEGLRFWTYWFGNSITDHPPKLCRSAILQQRERYLYKVFSSLSSPHRPIITGYLGHTLVWKRLQKLFPQAIFVRLHRNLIENALSILLCRKEDSNNWFSVFPDECKFYLRKSLHEQVAAQVYWLNRRLMNLNEKQTIHIAYDELCNDPKNTFQNIIDFCNTRGMRLKQIQSFPKSFPIKSVDFESNDAILIKQYLARIQNTYGSL